jgi:hypothetical protein
MKTHVEPEAPKTQRFLQYIYGELLDRAPLRAHEVIQIRVAENITPFPKITETADENAYGSDVEDELAQKAHRNLEKYTALDEYMRKTFWHVAASLFPEMESAQKFDVIISLAITNPAGVYSEAEKLGLKIPAVTSAEAQDFTAPAILNENPPEIRWRGVVVPIPSNSKQLCVCRVAFRKAVGESISWDEVKDEIDGGEKVHRRTTKKSVSDAVRQINKKITSAVGEPLLQTSNLSFYRLA